MPINIINKLGNIADWRCHLVDFNKKDQARRLLRTRSLYRQRYAKAFSNTHAQLCSGSDTREPAGRNEDGDFAMAADEARSGTCAAAVGSGSAPLGLRPSNAGNGTAESRRPAAPACHRCRPRAAPLSRHARQARDRSSGLARRAQERRADGTIRPRRLARHRQPSHRHLSRHRSPRHPSQRDLYQRSALSRTAFATHGRYRPAVVGARLPVG